MKRTIALLLAVLMLFTISGCSSNSPPASSPQEAEGAGTDADTAVFAVCGPMTGDNAEYGLAFRQAAQCQADLWNENGGLLGKQITLAVYDDKGSPEEAANIAQQIVSNEDIVAVIGHFSSSCSMAAAPIYQEHAMLEVSPTSSHADYPGIGDWMFRTTQRSTDEDYTLCDYVVNKMSPEVKKVGIFILNNDWGLESSALCQKLIKEYGEAAGRDIEIVVETVVEGNDDYSSVVTNFTNAGIDVLVNCATYPVAVPFLNQMKTAMPDLPVVNHFNCMVNQLIDVLGEKSVGMVFTAIFASFYQEENVVEFVQRFKAMDAKGLDPIPDSALYYDAAGILFQAVKDAGSFDREQIREALKAVEYDGVTGKLKFNENRECPRSCTFVTIDENLNWTEYKPQ